MKRLYSTLLCSALLAACGGGGGSADDQDPLSAIEPSSSVVTTSLSSAVTDAPSSEVTDPPSSDVTDGVANTAPVASAGPDRSVSVGSPATLDGSASSDANGNTLTYSWTLVSSPAGSSASLSGANAVSPSFTPDVAGPYVVRLTVNDGTVDSAPDSVTVNAAVGNAAPVADAGVDKNVNVGAPVTLDGSASTDANGDTLTYTWALSSWPNGSLASLSDPTAVNPSFTADVVGEYVLRLTVNDGTVDSAEDNVTVNATVGNAAPVANAGADTNANAGVSVTLDGSASIDADGDTLSYTWVVVSGPPGNSASLSDPTAVDPSFTADVAGEYVVGLTVDDGTVASTQDNVTVTVGGTEPVGFGDAPELEPPPAAGLRSERGVSYCEGHRISNGTIGNLEVPAGQSCVLESGVTVSNITLGAGAKLYAQGVDFDGNVTGQDGAARVVIEGSEIAGNVRLQSGVEITLRTNLINGSIQASANTGLVYLSGNTQPTGNIQLSANAGGVTVIGNQVGADLTCVDNDPAPTGGDNVAASKLGQCAGL